MGTRFCSRCPWIQGGRNKVYVLCRCKRGFSRRSILLTTALFLLMLKAGLLTSSAVGSRTVPAVHPSGEASMESKPESVSRPDTGAAAVSAIDALLERFEIAAARRQRVAEAIVRSSRRHKIDPRLIASVMIVESRGNPFAISSRDAVGIMQIHVPTWSHTVDQEEINLFKIEDNVDFGVRILKSYIDRYGHDEGIKRYNGWNPSTPEPSAAEGYLQRVQQIYLSSGAGAD